MKMMLGSCNNQNKFLVIPSRILSPQRPGLQLKTYLSSILLMMNIRWLLFVVLIFTLPFIVLNSKYLLFTSISPVFHQYLLCMASLFIHTILF